MKPLFALLSLLAFAAAQGAETPTDGLYLIASGTAVPQIESQDGKLWPLGAKQDLKVQDGRIAPNGGANKRFRLDITIPKDLKVRENNYILVVAGTAYRGLDYKCLGEQSCSLRFSIHQDRNARQVAGFLGIPIAYSQHPGYRLQVSFETAKPSFARGERVNVTLRIVNVDTKPISILNHFGLPDRLMCPTLRRTLYAFSAFKDDQPVPEIGKRPPPECTVTTYHIPPVILRPAETYEDTVNLSEWFGFKEPGAYIVRGTFPLTFLDLNDRSDEVIWEDYATGEFIIRIN